MEPEIYERVLGGSRNNVDGTAVAAIAAVRAAAGNVFLSTKTQAPAPAIAGGNMDVHLIDEHPFQYTAEASDSGLRTSVLGRN
jgi:hypothetical protein